MTFKGENQVMIFLAIKSMASTSERAMEWVQRIIYQIRNMVIFKVGIQGLEEGLSRNQYDKIKSNLKTM